MARTAQKAPAMMLGIFILILISYLTYIMLLHPWERKELLTQKSTIKVNVIDCSSGYPISDATIMIYTEEGELLSEEITDVDGTVYYEDFPDCYQVKASFNKDLFEGVCVGSGVEKVINFCYDYPQANPNVIFYEGSVGFVGETSGEAISTQELSNVVLSYPLSNATINYPSYFLYSNILWSEGVRLNLTDINENLTKSISLGFKMDSKRGDPQVKIYANNKLLFQGKPDIGERVSVLIPKQELNETIGIDLKCDFTGWFFWTTQDCGITNVSINQEFYTPKKVSQNLLFDTTPVEQESESIALSFTSSSETNGGVRAELNGVEVFNSNMLESSDYSATIPTASLELLSQDNNLTFYANPSAEAYLRGVKLNFTSPVTERGVKELEFFVTESEFANMNHAIINFFVSNIYLNGFIRFRINDVLYVSKVEHAGWNSLIIDKEDLLDNNTMIIDTLEGRFEITELKITYE